jgi:hypothetical protein
VACLVAVQLEMRAEARRRGAQTVDLGLRDAELVQGARTGDAVVDARDFALKLLVTDEEEQAVIA